MGRLVMLVPDEREACPEPGRPPRDSVFLQAAIMVADGTESAMFKIRNVSTHGMMAEGPISFDVGRELLVELRHVGRVRGKVTWARGNRFGFCFDHPIDPKAVRKPVDGRSG